MSETAKSFSVSEIIAVYNCENYLEKTLNSVIRQSIGFENIQLILVDDGSTDRSGKICDEYKEKYPDNIIVIHKENGGVSTARNAGLEVATGRYLNFLDSDDWWTSGSFKYAVEFLEEHPETDVVAFKMKYFDAQAGNHALNWKFDEGSRVVDLRKEPQYVQLSTSSAFFRRDAWGDLRYDTELRLAEDAKVATYLLTQKFTLGICDQGVYNYRRRDESNGSAVQTARKTSHFYTTKFERFFMDVLDNIKNEEDGKIPAYVQYLVMYDLQWHIRSNDLSESLSDAEKEAYFKTLRTVLNRIDDEVILAQRNLNPAAKLMTFKLKYDMLEADDSVSEIQKFRNLIGVQSDIQFVRWNDITFNKGKLYLHGSLCTIGDTIPDKFIFSLNDDKNYQITYNDKDLVSTLDMLSMTYHNFTCEIPVKDIRDAVSAQCSYTLGDEENAIEDYRVNQSFPLRKKLQYGYFYNWKHKIMAELSEDKLILSSRSADYIEDREQKLCKELLEASRFGEEAVAIRKEIFPYRRKLEDKSYSLIWNMKVAEKVTSGMFSDAQGVKSTPAFVYGGRKDIIKNKKLGKYIKKTDPEFKAVLILSDNIVFGEDAFTRQLPVEQGVAKLLLEFFCDKRIGYISDGKYISRNYLEQ